ncbi:MAG: septum formation initiator family protein [Elusimicrobia bacterium]|nr:septum formation initiator family protein [Elusimicrobiota bacterium]
MSKLAAPRAAAAFVREHWARLAVGAALIAAFFGNAGFRSLVSNWLELRRLNAQIVALDSSQKDLDQKLAALRSGDAVERAARRDLGYIRKGEIEYRFPAPRKAP